MTYTQALRQPVGLINYSRQSASFLHQIQNVVDRWDADMNMEDMLETNRYV